MTIEELIVSTVEDSTGLTCEHEIYTGNADTYCVYNYITQTESFDNAALFEYYHIMIHLVCPVTVNINAVKRKLKRDLQTAGFTYPTETSDTDENSKRFILETERWWAVNGDQ